MVDTIVYNQDPGTEVLVGNGSVINIVKEADVAAVPAFGVGVLGLVGTVVNDKGAPAVPIMLPNGADEIFATYGGFESWLGGGEATGYNGNLAAYAFKLGVPRVVLQPVDMAIRDATLATGALILVSLTRATATYGAFVLPAGTRIKKADGTYIVATLEPVTWKATETGAKTVRVQAVSGTPAAINTISVFVDAPLDTNVTVNTAATTVPAAMDATEIALRYLDAAKKLNTNPDGLSCTRVACDRTDAGCCEALATACSDHKAAGFFYKVFISPPIGTTPTNAQGSGTNGAQRAALVGTDNVAMVSPGWRRQFAALDKANLVGPKYMARFAGAIAAAAHATTIRPERNPAQGSEVIQKWGATELEQSLTFAQKVANYKAGIMTPEFKKTRRLGSVPGHRDGVLVRLSGGLPLKFADEALWDYLAQGLQMAVEPFQMELATIANRLDLVQNADDWLDTLQRPKDGSEQRIAGRNVTHVWDATNEMVTLIAVVQKLGNMDILTIRLRVTADEVVPIIT